jgi:hypothetical protein
MNKNKPILLFFENLVEPIQNTKAEFELIEKDIDLLNREFLLKGVFAYAFARFESSLSDCLKRYLNEIPSKLPMKDIDFKKNKEALINGSFTYKILELLVDEYIMKISYDTTNSFLKLFCELLSIDSVSSTFSNKLNEKKQRRNLLLHNNLVVNNKYIENTKSTADTKGTKLKISKEYLVESINEMKEVLSLIESRLSEKYSKFTRLKVIQDIWNYLFSSPILRFEDHWIIRNNEIIGYNVETAKKWSQNFSHSERSLLAYFLQNFNPGIIDMFCKFTDMSMFVSIDVEKVAYIVEVFEKYPWLLQDSIKRR